MEVLAAVWVSDRVRAVGSKPGAPCQRLQENWPSTVIRKSGRVRSLCIVLSLKLNISKAPVLNSFFRHTRLHKHECIAVQGEKFLPLGDDQW